jgi:hypothetical protein
MILNMIAHIEYVLAFYFGFRMFDFGIIHFYDCIKLIMKNGIRIIMDIVM